MGLACLMFAATQAVQVTIAPIGVMAVTGNPASMAVASPAGAGAIPANPTDASTYVQYTSAVAAGVTRKLQANWGTTDAAPAGCALRLTATPGSGQGTTAGTITMSSTATNIVTGIGGCATGTTSTSGAKMSYVLAINSMNSLVAGDNHTVFITLTLTDS